MNKAELMRQLKNAPGGELFVSVDMSSEEGGTFNRVYGAICGIQEEADGSITLFAENGIANYKEL